VQESAICEAHIIFGADSDLVQKNDDEWRELPLVNLPQDIKELF